MPEPREPLFSRLYNSTSQAINRVLPWHRWPGGWGLPVLFGIRDRLRRLNLRDTETLPSKGSDGPGPFKPEYLCSRSLDGTYNDLAHPKMGAVRTRFGRNVPLDKTYPNQAA